MLGFKGIRISGFRFQGLGLNYLVELGVIWSYLEAFGPRVGFRVWDLGFRVWDSWFRD